MKFYQAILSLLRERGHPVVSEYDLFRLIYDLHHAGSFKGQKLRGRRGDATRSKYSNVVRNLLSERYIRPDPDFYGLDELDSSNNPTYARVFRVSDLPDGTADDIAALIDPFCYISHLSAMQRYGLTNRIPEGLALSTPKAWSAARDRKIAEDYPSMTPDGYYAPLVQITLPSVLRKRPVFIHRTVRTPVIRKIRDSEARIASVGETFVQMLDRPELCGGMAHVLEVWEEHAATYLRDIIDAVGRTTEAIIKVRAGYILQERLGISDSRIEEWVAFAQRGGSRKLDPSKPYVSIYSEKWKISLNESAADTAS